MKIPKKVDFKYKDMYFKNIPIVSYNQGHSYFARMGGVSKVVRQYIKQKYSAIDFQIKSESFAGGNAINVWISPRSVSEEDYKEIASDLQSTFEAGRFNMMEDMYEYHDHKEISISINDDIVNFDTKYMMVNYGYKWGSKQYILQQEQKQEKTNGI